MKVKELTVTELYDKLLEQELFTELELRLITNMCGLSVETLNDAIFARYGYRDYNQMMEE